MILGDYYYSSNTAHHLKHFTIKVNDQTINEANETTTLRFSQKPRADNRPHFHSKNYFSSGLAERVNAVLRNAKQGTEVPTT